MDPGSTGSDPTTVQGRLALLAEIAAAGLTVDALTDERLEDLVVLLIEAGVISAERDRTTVSRYRRGPIDVVVEVTHGVLPIGGGARPLHSTRIFVECKHHARPVELDRAAKSFCVALREHPDELIIVSLSHLSPQAWDYAEYFFRTRRSRGVYPAIHFNHYRITDLVDRIAVPPAPGEEAGGPMSRVRAAGLPPHLLAWRLLRGAAPTPACVLGSSHADRPVALSAGECYVLEVVPGHCDHELTLEPGGGDAPVLRSAGACAGTSERRATTLRLTPAVLSRLPRARPLLVTFRLDCRSSGQHAISLPRILVTSGFRLADDLRAAETQDLLDRLLDPHGPTVLAIAGEAGVGKTVLGGILCQRLEAYQGYRTTSLLVMDQTTEAAFFRVLWPLVVDGPSDSDVRERTATVELLAAHFDNLLACAPGVPSPEGLGHRLASGQLTGVDREVLVYLCARLIAASPWPVTLRFQDCQYLSQGLRAALRLLVASLRELGCAQYRLLLERRSNPDDDAAWDRFLDDLEAHQHGTVLRYSVRPLTPSQLVDACERLFAGSEGATVAAALRRKAGGNPLFLTHLLHHLSETGTLDVAAVEGPGRFRVRDWPALEAELENLPPGVDALLGLRIRRWLAPSDTPVPLEYLVATAFGGFCVDDARARRAFGLSGSDCDDQLARLQGHGLVVPSLAAPPATFAHEMVQLAARREIAAYAGFPRVARMLLGTIRPDDFDDTLVAGRLASALSQPIEAFEWFSRGYELAHVRADLTQQRAALRRAVRTLEDIPSGTVADVRRRLAVGAEYAWAEMQAGSQHRALAHVEALRQHLRTVPPSLWPSRAEYDVHEGQLLQRHLTLLVRLLQPRRALEVFRQAYVQAVAPRQRLAVLTRGLLLCCQAGAPHAALALAVHAVRVLAEAPDDDAQASLLSDLGRLFLQARPDLTQALWDRAAELARERRQRTHCAINRLVVQTSLGAALPAATDLDAVRRDVDAQGIENQRIRLDLIGGVVAAAAGDAEGAHDSFGRGLRRALAVGQVAWEWKARNNLAVLARRREEHAEAGRQIQAARSAVVDLEAFTAHAEAQLAAVLLDVGIDMAATRLEVAGVGPLEPPAFCGAVRVLAHNARILATSTRSVDGPAPLTLPDRSPLLDRGLGPGGGYLALE